MVVLNSLKRILKPTFNQVALINGENMEIKVETDTDENKTS